MIVGSNNYVYVHGKHKSKVFLIKNSYDSKLTGWIGIGDLCFPTSCVGKRVRVKVEFVDEPTKSLDKNRRLVEPVSFEVNNY